MESTEIDYSEFMSPALMIGGAVAIICALGMFILWIITLVKQFKAGDTVWGVLTIFFSAIPAIIWSFMKGRTGLGIWWIIFVVGYIAAYFVAGADFIKIMMELEGVDVAPAAG